MSLVNKGEIIRLTGMFIFIIFFTSCEHFSAGYVASEFEIKQCSEKSFQTKGMLKNTSNGKSLVKHENSNFCPNFEYFRYGIGKKDNEPIFIKKESKSESGTCKVTVLSAFTISPSFSRTCRKEKSEECAKELKSGKLKAEEIVKISIKEGEPVFFKEKSSQILFSKESVKSYCSK